jgi:hypothetical protein
MRHALLFFTFLTLILGSVIFFTGLAPKIPKENAFTNIPKNHLLTTERLIELRLAEIKISHMLSNSNTTIGLFGNHLVRYMGEAALQANTSNERFFNFYVPHFSLDQIRDTLLVAEQYNALPCKLILIGVNNPVVRLRQTLGYFYANLPEWVFLSEKVISEKPLDERIQRHFTAFIREIEERTTWRNAAFGLSRLLDDSNVMEDFNNTWLSRLIIERWKYKPRYLYQHQEKVRVGLFSDGMYFKRQTDEEIEQGFVINQREIKNNSQRPRRYQFGTAEKVAHILTEIDNIARRNNRIAIFFAHPVLNPYLPSDPDQKELTKAFDLSQEIVLIDDRWHYRERKYFEDRLHVGKEYFSELMHRVKLKVGAKKMQPNSCSPI